MTGFLKDKKGLHRDTGRENLIKMEAETWARCPQAKECQLPATQEAGRETWNRYFSEPGEGPGRQTPDLGRRRTAE